MKKLTYTFKRFLDRKNKSKFKKRNRRKNKRYYTREIQPKFNITKDKVYVDRYAPKDLMLKYESVIDVLKYISLLKKTGKQNKNINIRLDNVVNIGEGAISMLLSVILELSKIGISIKGMKPNDRDAKNTLERSGFFKHMNGTIDEENLNTKNIIIRTGDNNSSQEMLAPEIIKVMETVWGERARCPLLFGGIGEMQRNSCDHAFNNIENITWHIGISHFENENTVKFSFVDNGVGIISRYRQKGLISKVIDFFKDDAEILENAFKNGIESRTGLSWRGLGLPTIFELYTDNIITNLVVITNDVFLDFDRKIFVNMNQSFTGTYYFWKVNRDCLNSHFPLNN